MRDSESSNHVPGDNGESRNEEGDEMQLLPSTTQRSDVSSQQDEGAKLSDVSLSVQAQENVKPKHHPLLGMGCVALASVVFQLMAVFVKSLDLPASELVMIRSCVQLICVDTLLVSKGINVWGPKAKRQFLTLRGAAGCVGLSAYFYTLQVLPLADSVTITFSNPIFTVILAHFWLKERLKPFEVAAIGVCVCGMFMISRPSFLFGGSGLPWDGLLVGFGGAFFGGLAYVSVRKVGPGVHPGVLVHYFSVASILISIPLLAWQGGGRTLHDVEWAIGIGVGVFGAGGQVLLNRGLQLDKAGRAATMNYFQVVLSFLVGTFYFHEEAVWTSIVGALLIIIAALAVAVMKARRSSAKQIVSGRS